MFKFDELCELIRLVGSTDVASVEIEHAGGRLRIDGGVPAAVASPAPAAVHAPAPTVEAATATRSTDPVEAPAAATAVVEGDGDDELNYVLSPIVGTFYRAPNPDADPYVKVGDAVDNGRTLCIVEAMKLMNEIESDHSGTIVKVFPENAQAVEFGERLFAIRPS
jgi:acetyl-CoA carboxylase biotin carboxyl carrier protein